MPETIAKEIEVSFATLGTTFVAVRSSATAEDGKDHAWAGQLESYLNVTKDGVLDKVKHCWASLFTPRAIFYRFEKGLHSTKISVAVVVQKMVESETSGIAFSVHPVTEDFNQLIIEAGFGLGEAIVSGQITPDSYVVEKEPRRILDKNISEQERAIVRNNKHSNILQNVRMSENEKGRETEVNVWETVSKEKGATQKLSDEQILELSELILKIERHYGFPCDIEWAFELGKFYIVQSRPITTLSTKFIVGFDSKEDKLTVLTELIHLDLPLIVADLTYRGETVRDIPWSKEPFTFKPYCAYERREGQVYYWYDKKGTEWKIEQAGKFDKATAIKNIVTLYEKVEPILKAEKALTKKQFEKFVEDLGKGWIWWDAMWWMIEYYDKHGLPKDDLMAARKRTEYLAPGVIATVRNTIKKLYPKYTKYADVILLEEVFSGDIPDEQILERRLQSYVFVGGELFVDAGEARKKYLFEFEEKVAIGADGILKGQTAYSGKVTGAVRLLNSRADMPKVQKGDVIIASTTTPDLLPAMKICGAIISEHGGAICHASITSRELKIPCVVGVKSATQILKDGDLVEVDAEKGVVRIVRKESGADASVIDQAKKIEWEHWVDRPYSPFMLTLNMTSANNADYKRVGFDESGFGYEVSLYQYPIFYYSKELEYRNREALEVYLRQHSIFDISKTLAHLHGKNKVEVEKILASSISAREKLVLCKEVMCSYAPYLWLNISLEKYYQERIDNNASQLIKGDTKEFISEVSVSKKKNAYGLLLDDLENGTPLETVHAKFGWMKSRDGFTDFYSIAELEEIQKNHKKIELKEVAVPDQLKDLVSELQELTFLRSDRTDKMYEMLGLIRPIFHEVAHSIGVPFKELEQYDVESIIAGMPRKFGRPFSCLYVGGIRILQEEQILSFEGELQKEIRGVSAYNGVVSGVVKVVRHPTEVDKVSTGDILVSQMTLPSFISALQKAVAFITDEGGITCHAAIVSRELKKPCIIGTKIATKVLKDGDLVEVDAEKGIVRIIKKAE
jgi:phosphoenolpyruvate synthase/pyruvate phosphate dikinase